MGIYDYYVHDSQGYPISLKNFRGKVVLIVNTATDCGFTLQYEELQSIYERFHSRGLEIIDIPCNQFEGLAPGSIDQIQDFCKKNYKTCFQQMAKASVNGEEELPLYTYLKEAKGFEGFGTSVKAMTMNAYMESIDKNYLRSNDIKWNFTKFLVDRQGRVVERFEPTADMEKVKIAIESLL